ncbi:hypothetical protein RZR97_02680 [Hydrogenimonas thermophila]|uniref:hypothetical protein n=1 Tax=Hydrogenimonas thermophila TaxID=223786 RepID=UPI002936FBAC|nr:hypothetical protein [Hydrogenimonas thermophila]WOE70485.1 hypothetical protein RZR91_02695 [Hydrogenimonas thermophila]WOE73002.1 hypothetical protein RZR97_02680 [Hydrogenimonas thermophila]
MAVIDNVLKKIGTQETKKVSFTIKVSSKLNDDLQYICKEFGISKSQLVEEILESSGISKKVADLKASKQQNEEQDQVANSNQNQTMYGD